MLRYWLWLTRRQGLSNRMVLTLLDRFQTPEAVYGARAEDLDAVTGMTRELRTVLQDRSLADAERILALCSRAGIRLLTWSDSAYPAALRNIADPPALLYCRGTLPDWNSRPLVGIVGTRKATGYGIYYAGSFGGEITRCGGIVVSGMAAGIDAAAMSAALDAGGPVVGVLGFGPDRVYPESNRALFRAVEENGCLISEYPPGTPPAKWTFPRRNRIISGLSRGVLLVEAPEKSGALITCRRAMEQGRDVFVVPGNLDMPTFAGSNRVMRDGGIPVTRGWDVMELYADRYPDRVQSPPAAAEKPVPAREKKEVSSETKKNTIDKAATSPYSDVNTVLDTLTGEEQQIVALLREGELPIDELAAGSGMTTGKLLAQLTMLELKGVVKRLPGRRITLK